MLAPSLAAASLCLALGLGPALPADRLELPHQTQDTVFDIARFGPPRSGFARRI